MIQYTKTGLHKHGYKLNDDDDGYDNGDNDNSNDGWSCIWFDPGEIHLSLPWIPTAVEGGVSKPNGIHHLLTIPCDDDDDDAGDGNGDDDDYIH